MVDAGNEALEFIASNSFDQAVLDMGLEDMNPQALVRDIRVAALLFALCSSLWREKKCQLI